MWGRFRRWPRLTPLLLVAGTIAIGVWLYVRAAGDRSVRLAAFSEPAAVVRAGLCQVLQVIDATTLQVRQAEFNGPVRLLGIDAPEASQRDAAIKFLVQRVAAGEVRIELDKRRLDSQGRFLAYVYVGNQLLNEDLVAAGLARVQTYPGDSMTINRQLLRAQAEARNKERGMWAKP